jgi:hypothetical protein
MTSDWEHEGRNEVQISARDAEFETQNAPERGAGARAARNTEPLTAEQKAAVLKDAKSLGINPDDLLFRQGTAGTVYSDMMDKVVVGPNVLPKGGEPVLGTRSAAEAGSALDEFQASIVGRRLPGLTSTERFQLMRDAVERARSLGANARDLVNQLKHIF